MPATTPHIQLREVVKTYATPAGELRVLDGVNLTIQRGEFVALVGPSGSGKTTLLNVLTGIDRPTSGQIIVDEVEITRRRPGSLTRWRGRTFGIVFQQFQLLPTLTIAENIILPMDFCNIHKPAQRRSQAQQLLERFEIGHQADKTPDMLSGGQQQRVAIARALANSPAIIVADEPTANLDRMSAQIVFRTFEELTRAGHTVLMVTHDRDLVRDVPRKISLVDGRVEDLMDSAILRRSQVLKRATQETKRATQEIHKLHVHQGKPN